MKKSNVKKSTSTKTSSTKSVGTSTKKAAHTSTEAKNILETKEANTITLNKPSTETPKVAHCETKEACIFEETTKPIESKISKSCTAKKNAVDFTFKVNNKTSYFGEKLYVCGNIKELGSWDIKNAFNLSTDENLYPSWKGTIALPIDTYIEFKFVSVGNDGTNENVIWEDGENRAATITEDSDKYETDWNIK